MKNDYVALKQKYDELDSTLEEMGLKLGKYESILKFNAKNDNYWIHIFFSSHLKMQDFKEVTKQLHEFQWENDEV